MTRSSEANRCNTLSACLQWLIVIATATLASSCASPIRTVGLITTGGWYDDYQAAEHAAARSSRAILIHYTDAEPGRPDPMAGTLRASEVRNAVSPYVRCRLYKEFEADRRYVAQFGVERAPSIILLHTDGTFHARVGNGGKDDLRAFFEQAVPPGKTPELNPLIPRDVDNYWYETLGAAEYNARITGRPLFVVYYRTLSRDWSNLEPLLANEQVAGRLATVVPCRISVGGWFPQAHNSPFGAMRLPAMVLADPATREANILERPLSADAVAGVLVNGPDGAPAPAETAEATP